MKSIGIRVSPSVVDYCITEKNDEETVTIILVNKIKVPKALDMPSSLAFIRGTLFSIFTEFNIQNAGVRIQESISPNVDIRRIYFEGVVQELLANCNITKYFIGKKVTISSLLNVPIKEVTDYIDGKNNLVIFEVPKSAISVRECIITSIAASELEGEK